MTRWEIRIMRIGAHDHAEEWITILVDSLDMALELVGRKSKTIKTKKGNKQMTQSKLI
jgi:hypothetical protein